MAIKRVSPPRKPGSLEESWRIRIVSRGNFTGKIDHLPIPVFNFMQVTVGTSTDPQQDIEWAGERDCGGLRKNLWGVRGLMKKNLDCTCTVVICIIYAACGFCKCNDINLVDEA